MPRKRGRNVDAIPSCIIALIALNPYCLTTYRILRQTGPLICRKLTGYKV